MEWKKYKRWEWEKEKRNIIRRKMKGSNKCSILKATQCEILIVGFEKN